MAIRAVLTVSLKQGMEVRPTLAEGAECETAHGVAGKVSSHQGGTSAVLLGQRWHLDTWHHLETGLRNDRPVHMNVPLYDSTGLNIYRELMHRENRCAADWSVNYGAEALQNPPDPQLMMNLGKFAKFASVPMPLDVQLRELRKERRAQSAKVTRFEKDTFPTSTEIPVSAMSVDIWGDKAWHTQSKKAQGAPSTYKKFEPPPTRWSRRQWDVDNIKFVREGLAPAHVNARLRKHDGL